MAGSGTNGGSLVGIFPSERGERNSHTTGALSLFYFIKDPDRNTRHVDKHRSWKGLIILLIEPFKKLAIIFTFPNRPTIQKLILMAPPNSIKAFLKFSFER